MEPVPFEQVVADHGAAVLRVCRALLGPDDARGCLVRDVPLGDALVPGARPAGPPARLAADDRSSSVDRSAALPGRAPVPAGVLPDTEVAAASDGVRLEDADRDLLGAVARLPPRQRGAVAYRYLADLSYEQVGELLGSNATAARRSAADGIAALRADYRPGGTT